MERKAHMDFVENLRVREYIHTHAKHSVGCYSAKIQLSVARNVKFTCSHSFLKKVTNAHLGTKLAKCPRERATWEEINKRSETLTHVGNTRNE